METYISEQNHVLSFYGRASSAAGVLGNSNFLCSIHTSVSWVASFRLLGDEGNGTVWRFNSHFGTNRL